jgi:hypothetical protein
MKALAPCSRTSAGFCPRVVATELHYSLRTHRVRATLFFRNLAKDATGPPPAAGALLPARWLRPSPRDPARLLEPGVDVGYQNAWPMWPSTPPQSRRGPTTPDVSAAR